MNKKFTTFTLLLGLISSFAFPITAQVFARVQMKNPTSQTAPNSNMKQLKAVLNDLRTHYKKDILYFDRNIESYSINLENINYKDDLEQNLKNIFKGTDLSFKKSKNGGYIIVKNKSKETIQENQFPENSKKEMPNENSNERANINDLQTEKSKDETVKGKVVDENGLALYGVSILLKGTKKGISTDRKSVV